MNEPDSNDCFICSGGEWTPRSRAEQLGRLVAGDLVHASGPTLPTQICLVTGITETGIQARSVTIQFPFLFNRKTGVGVAYEDGHEFPCTIDSIEPLPVEIHQTLLGLERKYRLVDDLDKLKLDKHEMDALLFIGGFYRENPLPAE